MEKENLLKTELLAEIRNKLQGSKTALEMILSGKNISRDFAEIALKDLDRAVELLRKL